MWAIWKKQRGPGRADLLAAVPVKNPCVREKALPGAGKGALGASVLRLTGAAESPLGAVAPRTAGAGFGKSRAGGAGAAAVGTREKSFDLDELGAFVWQAADGTRTVEALIRHFAGEKRVNLREAEVAVLAFLKTLAKKNLLALRVENRDSKSAARSGA